VCGWFATYGANGEVGESYFFKILAHAEYSSSGSSVIEMTDKSFLIVGSLFDDAGPSTWGWVAKTDSKGKMLWEKEFGKQARSSAFYRASATSDGGALLVGSINGNSSGPLEVASAWIVKLNKNGHVLWDKVFSVATVTRAIDLQVMSGGEAIVAGRVRQDRKDSIFLAKFSPSGEMLWQKHVHAREGAFGNLVYILKDGGFVVGGRSSADTPANKGWIARLDSRGNLLWDSYIAVDTKGQQTVSAVMELEDESLLLGLDAESAETAWILKLKRNGTKLWEKQLSSREFCRVLSLWRSATAQITVTGQACRNASHALWMVTVSESGEISSANGFISESILDIDQITPISGGDFLAVGNTGLGVPQAWVFKGRF
jgi:hypothetical protein